MDEQIDIGEIVIVRLLRSDGMSFFLINGGHVVHTPRALMNEIAKLIPELYEMDGEAWRDDN